MIYLCGDLHGGEDGSTKYLNSRNFPEQKTMTKDDILVQLGDFGYIWWNENNKRHKEDVYWQKWFANKRYTTFIVPGNHENWDIIMELPIEEKWGGKVRVLKTDTGNLYLAITGEIYIIDGYKILTICGADSTDKLNRIPHIEWWPQEAITNKSIDNTLNNLDKPENKPENKSENKSENKPIDFIFSHTMPQSMIDQFIPRTTQNNVKFKDGTAELLEHIWTNYDITYGVHCGHFHMNLKQFRKIPYINEQGNIIYKPDCTNNYVQCYYMSVPKKLEV